MKMPKILVFFLSAICCVTGIYAQSDSVAASRNALLYADSLVNAFRSNDWDEYLTISYPGIVQYHGGREGFKEYSRRVRGLNKDLDTNPERIQLLQMSSDKNSEWQCVIKKSRETFVDGKKALVVSYMIGQSVDKGKSWKYFDIAYNSVENVAFIMPDIFDKLAIPNREVIYEKQFVKGP